MDVMIFSLDAVISAAYRVLSLSDEPKGPMLVWVKIVICPMVGGFWGVLFLLLCPVVDSYSSYAGCSYSVCSGLDG